MPSVARERRKQLRSSVDADWARHIERALSGCGLRTVYQPIVDLARRTVVGYEALTRFDPIDGVAVAPDRWFQAANTLGVGPQLDAVAMGSALANRADLPTNCFLTINVDPESLLDKRVSSLLASHGNLAGVIIEVTEHRPWEWEQLGPVVDRLRANGALFAVDDAGAGHSGLQQILQLRPSIIKLDRMLVHGIERDEAKSALVEMVGLFANRVDAWVLAEGVETVGEAKRLVELEVPLTQGYYFGRPAPIWTSLEPRVTAELCDHARTSGETLHRYVEPVASIPNGVELGEGRLSSSDPWVVVVDGHRRPLGLLDDDAAMTGHLVPALVVNVHSSPAEAANRLVTAEREPSAPIVVTDNAGRYLGLVTVRRLLSTLANRSEGLITV